MKLIERTVKVPKDDYRVTEEDCTKKAHTYWDYELNMSILECASCGTLVLCFEDASGGQRLNGHKCAGRWNTICVFKDVKFDQADINIYNRVERTSNLPPNKDPANGR